MRFQIEDTRKVKELQAKVDMLAREVEELKHTCKRNRLMEVVSMYDLARLAADEVQKRLDSRQQSAQVYVR